MENNRYRGEQGKTIETKRRTRENNSDRKKCKTIATEESKVKQ